MVKKEYKEIYARDLMKSKEFNFGMGAMVLWTAAFLYQSTIINPMLAEIYQMEPEKSTLFFTIAGIAFLVATPVAFELRKRRMAKRRTIQYVSLVGMGVGMIIRTGNFGEDPHLWWVYVG